MEINKILKGRCGIYMLYINKHRYVGSSINLYYRLKHHFNDLKNHRHHNTYLQRTINKYGIDKLNYHILEICNPEIEYVNLLKKEKYFIEKMNCDLNLKLDPINQQGCITTIISVYQFNQFGDFIKKWSSASEAARALNLHPSGITMACRRPLRQRLAGGYLWSYEENYPFDLSILYVYDLKGNYLSKHINTIDIYETYFKNIKRKTVLSQLKKKIDSNSPYKYIYIYSTQEFTGKIYNINELTFFNKLKEINPIINTYNQSGQIILFRHFNDYHNKMKIMKRLQNYGININNITNKISLNYQPDKFKKIIARNILTKEIFYFSSITKAASKLFNNIKDTNNISKHIKRNTPYKGFIFRWDL